MKQLLQWLQGGNLEKYYNVLEENAVDMDVLPELSEDDLRELGLPLGDRRRLLKAIALLKAPAAAAPATLAHAERRQLTVMFCDLVGSTALSTQLDAEQLRDVLREYQDTCMRAIEPFGGTIARAYGDGLLIYFGYPIAHDDEASRAVSAAIDIVDALNRLSVEGKDIHLQVRIGIHTGNVVVGGLRPDDQLDPMGITGDAPNIAARLQEKASPNEIVVSRTTRLLAGNVASFESLGEYELKGLPDVFTLFRTTALDGAVRDGGRAAPSPDFTMIGRQEELARLMDAWRSFAEGELRAALITGPPGIGKSQLLGSFAEQLLAEGGHPIQLRCSSLRVQSPFLPIVELFRRELNMASTDPAAEQLEKLEKMVIAAQLDLPESMSLLAPVLAIPAQDKYPLIDLPAERRVHETIRVIACCLASFADAGRAALLVEDLHWIDSSTLAVLRHFIEAYAERPMFVLGTARSEFDSPWEGSPGVRSIVLEQFDEAASRRLIHSVNGAEALSEEIVQHIISSTDGVPLFVEELTKWAIEAQSLGELPADLTKERLAVTFIPASLQDSLLSRLDRLGGAKRIAQLGATIGREFSHQLLHSISDLDANSLRPLIDILKNSGLVVSRGKPPHETFVFKHAMVQGAAYSTLLHSDRVVYHRRIARAVAREAELSGVPQPQLLAHHFTEAGDLQDAVPQWLDAGKHAAGRNAIPEAINQLNTGLELIRQLDDTPEIAQLELELHDAIAMPIASTRGYTSDELRSTLDRAQSLCRKLGSPAQLFPSLHGMLKFYQAQADHKRAEALGRELLAIAENADDTSLLIEAHRNLGMSYALSGRFVQSVAHCEQALRLYEPERHLSHGQFYAVNPSVVAGSFAGFSKWMLGDTEQGLQHLQQAVSYAREIEHPYSLAFSLCNAANVSVFRGDVESTFHTAREALELSKSNSFPYWVGWSSVPLGWALCKMGKCEEGLAAIQLGIGGYEAAGVRAGRPLRYCLQADAVRMGGEKRVALILGMLDEVLAMPELHLDSYQSQVYRMRGDLLRDSGEIEAAGQAYQRSLEAARDQKAMAFEKHALEALEGLGIPVRTEQTSP